MSLYICVPTLYSNKAFFVFILKSRFTYFYLREVKQTLFMGRHLLKDELRTNIWRGRKTTTCETPADVLLFFISFMNVTAPSVH